MPDDIIPFGPDVQIVRLEPEEPGETWTIEKGKSFAYRLVDAQGRERGRYKDADTMASHFVFALQRCERLSRVAAKLAELAEAYEQWEADLILSEEAWDGGIRPLPILTYELWDRLLEIQGMRNAALAAWKESQ